MIVGSDPGRSAEAVAGSNQLDEVVKPEKMAKIEQPSKQLDRVVKPEMKPHGETTPGLCNLHSTRGYMLLFLGSVLGHLSCCLRHHLEGVNSGIRTFHLDTNLT